MLGRQLAAGGKQRGLAALTAFAVVASPWISVLSVSKGRLTWGDVGPLAYAAFM